MTRPTPADAEPVATAVHRDGRIAVVGGGPAGLIAAQELARCGGRVVLLDASPSVGRKFLLAGRGGLNLTHSEPLGALIDRYGDAAPRLRAALEGFTPTDLRAWCLDLGEPTFVGSSGRVFPESFRANRLLDSWLARLDELGVDVRTGMRWRGTEHAHAGAGLVAVCEGPMGPERVPVDAVVLALGGASWPTTGSDGSWVPLLVEAGVEVRPLRPANSGVQVRWSEVFSNRFAGTPVKNISVRCGDHAARGELMITDDGLEGGAVYALSTPLRVQLDEGAAVLSIDLLPDLDDRAIRARLARRRPKDSMATVLTRHLGLDPVRIGLLREATGNQLPTDPAALADLLRTVGVQVTATSPIERAISSAGGVALDEVDQRFMLRRVPGVFVAGEMLDWEAPTGGYLLQASFSTGVAAARGALAWLGENRSAPHGT